MDKLSAVEIWAEMYNKKDKEHFECQLKLAKLEQKLDKIKLLAERRKDNLELCYEEYKRISCWQDMAVILDIIKE